MSTLNIDLIKIMLKRQQDKKVRVCNSGRERALSSEREINLHLAKQEIYNAETEKKNQEIKR